MSDFITAVFELSGVVVVFIAGMLWYRRLYRRKPLAPGNCECTHPRCVHVEGKEHCKVAHLGGACACMIYIPMDGENLVERQELKLLRKMAGLDK